MRGSTHLAGGLLAGALVGHAQGIAPTEMAVPLLAAGIASLVPDWLQVNLPGVNTFIKGVVGHRGLTHWAIIPLLIALCTKIYGVESAIFAAAGWASHLLLDVLSGGAPVLWPWPGRITLANVKTGGRIDTLVGAACLVIASVIMLGRFV